MSTIRPIQIEPVFFSNHSLPEMRQETWIDEERASKIIDKLIDIVGSLYRIDEEVATTSEKIHFLSSLNSSTVNKLKEFVEQNLSYSMENETMEQVTGGNDGNSGYSMKFWLRITWDLLFFLIIFVAIVGNLLVLWIVTAHSYMRTVPNVFIVNMSLSDLMMAALNCIFNYIFMRDRNWYFGSTYCHINNFIAIVSVAASVLNLTAMSIDRYKAIVWPLRVRTSKVVVAAVIILIWLGSILFALPALLLSTTLELRKDQYVCYIKWPDEDTSGGTSNQDYVYNILILLVTYVLPIILIGVCSFHMGVVLWMRQPVGVITPQLQRARRKKQKIVKMLVVLIVIFGVCWFPYHMYFLYVHHFPEVRKVKNIQHYFLAFYWFAMTHSMVNPIVYYLMNPKFRRYYRYVLTLKCLKPSKRDAPAGMFLASAFGLQVAAQLAYGAPANGCPRHRSSERRHYEERNGLFRSNTIQVTNFEDSGRSQRNQGFDGVDILGAPRRNQSHYEASYRKRNRKVALIKSPLKESQEQGVGSQDNVEEVTINPNTKMENLTDSSSDNKTINGNLIQTIPLLENVQIENSSPTPSRAFTQLDASNRNENITLPHTKTHKLSNIRLATPEHDFDDTMTTSNNAKSSRPIPCIRRQIVNSCSTSVPVTPKILLTDTKQRPTSANTEGRGRSRNPRSFLSDRRNPSSDRLSRQGNMSSGESLYAYMDPYMITYATPLSDCEDIMELDDEIELEKSEDSNNLNVRSPNSNDSNANANKRRKSKNSLLQVLDPLMKLEEKSRGARNRRKSDCNIILNGELVAVGWRRNSATIKICNQTLTDKETVF